MARVTVEIIKKCDDWRDFYLKSGADMLKLAKDLLVASDKASISLGLKIVEEALFEEELENPDSVRSLSELNFGSLIPGLLTLLKKKEFTSRAIYGLWVVCQKGASIDLKSSLLEDFL